MAPLSNSVPAEADAAIDLVPRLAATHGSSDDDRLFRPAQEFEQDCAAVRSLLARLGASARSPKRVAGRASAVLPGLVAGGQPGRSMDQLGSHTGLRAV